MTALIVLFGALTLVAGLIILVNPEKIFGLLRKHYEKPTLHFVAVIVRLGLGAILILQSESSKYPVLIEILGWVTVVAALLLAAMGRQNFKRLMSWALNDMKSFARAGGLIAVLFGGFLIHAFV